MHAVFASLAKFFWWYLIHIWTQVVFDNNMPKFVSELQYVEKDLEVFTSWSKLYLYISAAPFVYWNNRILRYFNISIARALCKTSERLLAYVSISVKQLKYQFFNLWYEPPCTSHIASCILIKTVYPYSFMSYTLSWSIFGTLYSLFTYM